MIYPFHLKCKILTAVTMEFDAVSFYKYFEGIFAPPPHVQCRKVFVCVCVFLCKLLPTVGIYLTAKLHYVICLTTLIFIGRLQLSAKNCARLPKLHGVTSLNTVLTLRHLVLPAKKCAQDLQDQYLRYVRFPFMTCTVDFYF